jgi:hypothetical protein
MGFEALFWGAATWGASIGAVRLWAILCNSAKKPQGKNTVILYENTCELGFTPIDGEKNGVWRPNISPKIKRTPPSKFLDPPKKSRGFWWISGRFLKF